MRLFWDDAEKVQMIAQTRIPGVSVAQAALRYDVNANLIFKWLRDPRFSSAPESKRFRLFASRLPGRRPVIRHRKAPTPIGADRRRPAGSRRRHTLLRAS